MGTDRSHFASVKAVLSWFHCGREGHVAKDCRRRTMRKACVGRDTPYKNGAGRYTDNLSTAQNKGWIRSENDRRELSSNPTTARRNK